MAEVDGMEEVAMPVFVLLYAIGFSIEVYKFRVILKDMRQKETKE